MRNATEGVPYRIIEFPDTLLAPEREFVGVYEGPSDVFEGIAAVFGRLDVGCDGLGFFGCRRSREGGPVEGFDDFLGRLF